MSYPELFCETLKLALVDSAKNRGRVTLSLSQAVLQFNLLDINLTNLTFASYIIIIVDGKDNNINLEISKLAQNDCSSNGC